MIFNYQLVNEIVEAIRPLLPYDFGSLEEGASEDIENIEEQVFNVDNMARISFGASKLVILSPKLGDVVIKIPFNGYYIEEEEDNYWTPFEYASGSDPADYCLAEFEKYQELKRYKLNCFVAKTILYKKIKNIRIFIQEWVTTEQDTENNPPASPRSQKLAKQWFKEKRLHISNLNWVANCIDIYGESKMKHFLDYCNNIDSDIIQDFHRGNYGYRLNGTPCILDYSGFFE